MNETLIHGYLIGVNGKPLSLRLVGSVVPYQRTWDGLLGELSRSESLNVVTCYGKTAGTFKPAKDGPVQLYRTNAGRFFRVALKQQELTLAS